MPPVRLALLSPVARSLPTFFEEAGAVIWGARFLVRSYLHNSFDIPNVAGTMLADGWNKFRTGDSRCGLPPPLSRPNAPGVHSGMKIARHRSNKKTARRRSLCKSRSGAWGLKIRLREASPRRRRGSLCGLVKCAHLRAQACTGGISAFLRSLFSLECNVVRGHSSS